GMETATRRLHRSSPRNRGKDGNDTPSAPPVRLAQWLGTMRVISATAMDARAKYGPRSRKVTAPHIAATTTLAPTPAIAPHQGATPARRPTRAIVYAPIPTNTAWPSDSCPVHPPSTSHAVAMPAKSTMVTPSVRKFLNTTG